MHLKQLKTTDFLSFIFNDSFVMTTLSCHAYTRFCTERHRSDWRLCCKRPWWYGPFIL